MKISIILPCFKRMNYLNYNLWSLAQQKISYNIETMVLNEYLPNSGAEKICNKFKNKLNIRYIFTGQRNKKKKIIARDQGFALNIGVKQAKGEIIILTGNGLFHLNDTINLTVAPLIENKRILSVPKSTFFDKGEIADYLSKNLIRALPASLFSIPASKYWGIINYAYKLPFFMAMYKQEFIDIGGHDEDFIGLAGLDDDLVSRLTKKGLKFRKCGAEIIHLYHPKSISIGDNRWANSKWTYNTFLRLARKNIIVRNKNREWGVL